MEGSKREVINLEEEDWDPGSANRSNIVREEERLGTPDNPIAFWPATNNPESANRSDIGSNTQEKEPWPNLAGTAHNPIALCNPAEISRVTGINLDDPEVLAAIMDDDCFIVDVESQDAEVVDLSSSDDDDSGEADHIAEEQEEIVTTLSREDSLVFAEVMKVIKEGGDLRKFKVDELKTYLRHHGLRMSGAKFELLTRIQEHRRIKDPGRAEEIYPRVSFSIDCKGDVCHGDVVLFLQTVYNMGSSLGKRWVAGKVVSESYGAGKQQHTFTIEVLWSQGIQPFYCMRPVKIKGRNLYRMVTMRQPWSNEAGRQKVLDEKHGRGAAARAIRRAVKDRHKSKGKSRADARVHPYGPESSRAPQQSAGILRTPQQSAGIHTRSSFHQGSSSTTTLPLRHNASTERMVHETFNPGRPRTSFTDTQDSERRVPGPAHYLPPPKVHETRSFHREQDRDSEWRVPGPAYDLPPPQVYESWSFHREQDRDRRAPPKQRRINSQHHAILCSNTKCEQAGALQCITRLCGSCCYKTTAKGVCQRHR